MNASRLGILFVGAILVVAFGGLAVGLASASPTPAVMPPPAFCSLSVLLTAHPPTLVLGQGTLIVTLVLFLGHPNTCTGTPMFHYAGLPAGCHAVSSPVLYCVPTALGNYTATVHVYFANGFGSAGVALQIL